MSSLALQRSGWSKTLLALTLLPGDNQRSKRGGLSQPRCTLMLHQQRALLIPGGPGKPSISPTPGLIERTVFGSWVILLLLRLPPFFQGPLTVTSSGKPSLAAPESWLQISFWNIYCTIVYLLFYIRFFLFSKIRPELFQAWDGLFF